MVLGSYDEAIGPLPTDLDWLVALVKRELVTRVDVIRQLDLVDTSICVFFDLLDYH